VTVVDDRDADPADLAAAVLEEEALRQAEQRSRDTTGVVLPDDLLPGVGDEQMALLDVVQSGGMATITVLSLLNLVDEFDRAALQVLAPDIQDSLAISDTLLGALAGLTGLFFILGAVPLGYLADRTRRPYLVAVCSVVFTVFTLLTGFVRNAWQLAVTRVMTGIGKANSLPVHGSLLADAYPIAGRSRVFAIHNLANPVGLLLGPLLAGGVAAMAGGSSGWRWAFVVLAVPAAALALAAAALPEPTRGRNEQLAVLGDVTVTDERPIPLAAAFARLRGIRTFYFFLLGLGVLGFALFSVPLFLNLYLEDRFGLDAFDRGIVLSLTYLGGLVGAPLGGVLGDRLFRQSPPQAVVLIAGAVAGYGVLFTIGLYMPGLVALTAVISLGVGLSQLAFVVSNAVNAAVIPYRLRSQGFAMVGLYLFVVGSFFGSIITGGLSDAFGERTALTLVVPPSALIGAALIAYGARFVRGDLSLVVEELREEKEEHQRVASGAEVPILQIRNLDFSYGQVQVLFGVEIDVREGEVLALLGTNGAGKSTLLRAVSGLAMPDRGVIRLRGRTITYLDAETRVGMGIVQVPGGKAIFPSLTVEENLVAGAYTFAADRRRLRQRIDGAVDLFPVLGERMAQPAGSLSGGEQQMLAIAKALLHDPDVLLLDELSLGLAPVVVQEILATVERLKAKGVTMVIVEQSVNVALSVADRAVFMEKGQVRFQGPAAELLERDDLVRAVFLGGEHG
jgi:ABC-type branched-subunit amino acid transport system ATPase component/predicted MFS family arabinose efflux permease